MGNKIRVMETQNIKKSEKQKSNSDLINCLICNKKVLHTIEKHKCELRNYNQELIIK